MDDEYEEYDLTLGGGDEGEDKDGVFVFINQVDHKLHYPEKDSTDWGKQMPLDYDCDVRRLLDTFNLKTGAGVPDPYNLIRGRNLTNASGGNSFDDFMTEKVLEYDHKPSFLLFVLMSHGFEDGVFLLSTKTDSPLPTRQACCIDVPRHTHGGECHSRHIIRDVIDRVAACKIYDNIPKIFVMQMCRGSNSAAVEIGEGDGEVVSLSSENDLFVPKHPDIFLFRAAVESNYSWVTKVYVCKGCGQISNEKCKYCMSLDEKGSFLIRSLCESIDELNKSRGQREALVNELYKHRQSDCRKRSYECIKYQLRPEDMIDGWMTGVCQRTTAKVSNNLITVNSLASDKQQVHINNTFSKKLSFIRILKIQGVMMEGPQETLV